MLIQEWVSMADINEYQDLRVRLFDTSFAPSALREITFSR